MIEVFPHPEKQQIREKLNKYGLRRAVQEGVCWVHFKKLKLVWSLLVLCKRSSSQFSRAHPNKGWFLYVCSEKVTKMCSDCVWLCSLFLVAVLRMCEATNAELRQRVVRNSCHFCKIVIWAYGFGRTFWMFWTSNSWRQKLIIQKKLIIQCSQIKPIQFVGSAPFCHKFMDNRWRENKLSKKDPQSSFDVMN